MLALHRKILDRCSLAHVLGKHSRCRRCKGMGKGLLWVRQASSNTVLPSCIQSLASPCVRRLGEERRLFPRLRNAADQARLSTCHCISRTTPSSPPTSMPWKCVCQMPLRQMRLWWPWSSRALVARMRVLGTDEYSKRLCDLKSALELFHLLAVPLPRIGARYA